MRKPPGMLGLKKFGPGKIWVENVWTQNTCILGFLHTFILISENPTKTQIIFINFLTKLGGFKNIDFFLKFFGSTFFWGQQSFLGHKKFWIKKKTKFGSKIFLGKKISLG